MEGRLGGPPGKIGEKITPHSWLNDPVTSQAVFPDIHVYREGEVEAG